MLPYKLNYSFWAIAIMEFGKLYKEYEDKIDTKIMSWKYAVVSFILFLYLIHDYNVIIIYFGCPNWFLSFIIPFTGMHWMIYTAKYLISNCKFLLFIGANSLVYFALHRQILNVVEHIAKKVMNSISIQPSLFSNLVEVIIIALLIIIPTLLINKYIPHVTGKGWKLWNLWLVKSEK